jgi:hypothetical protein
MTTTPPRMQGWRGQRSWATPGLRSAMGKFQRSARSERQVRVRQPARGRRTSVPRATGSPCAADECAKVDEDPLEVGPGEDHALFGQPVETFSHRVTLQHALDRQIEGGSHGYGRSPRRTDTVRSPRRRIEGPRSCGHTRTLRTGPGAVASSQSRRSAARMGVCGLPAEIRRSVAGAPDRHFGDGLDR